MINLLPLQQKQENVKKNHHLASSRNIKDNVCNICDYKSYVLINF